MTRFTVQGFAMIEEWFVNVLAIDILMPDEQVDRMWVDPHYNNP